MNEREDTDAGSEGSPQTPSIVVGAIETGVPLPTTRSRPLDAAQLRILELPVGGSFLLTHRHSIDEYGRTYASDEPNRLRCWATTKGIRLCVRKMSERTHRIWRVE
jgi:hypothetical protein